jgi:NTE family protein
METRSSATGLVLAGAAALGAYEAGVLQHLCGPVARDVGRERLFDVVSGTSAGAINASAVAAFADRPLWGAQHTCQTWSGLRLGRVLRPSAIELLRMTIESTDVTARLGRALRGGMARGGFLDPGPIERLLAAALPIDRIDRNLADGRLRAIAISVTHVATGRASVFFQTARPTAPWTPEGGRAVRTRLTLTHAMASAAIPLVLPPVMIDGDLYCDGGLRQLVPLSPSIHLGARRVLVINPLSPVTADGEATRRAASTSLFYLAGKALNALFVDRTEIDVTRLEQLTAVLRAGRRRYGPAFEAEINDELAELGAPPLHEVIALRIGPSRDLGQMAAEYARSPELARRERSVIAWVMRGLAELGPTRTGDLLSYLMFDGGFAAELIALGERDARTHHDELCAFFAP